MVRAKDTTPAAAAAHSSRYTPIGEFPVASPSTAAGFARKSDTISSATARSAWRRVSTTYVGGLEAASSFTEQAVR